MGEYAEKLKENRNTSVANHVSRQHKSESEYKFVDSHAQAIGQRKLQNVADSSPRVQQLKATQEMADNGRLLKQFKGFQAVAGNIATSVLQRKEDLEEEEPLQGKFKFPNAVSGQQATVQRFALPAGNEPGAVPAQKFVLSGPSVQKKANHTGLPDQLKSGVENLSGIDISDVKVHYNSAKPAQLQALAYAQGSDIHIGPGQERHLPHEAWHVVQQKQGRVQPTIQMKQGVAVNDDSGLEREADVMGAKAMQGTRSQADSQSGDVNPVQMMSGVIQMVTPLVTDRLNVVGEEHPESAPRVVREKQYTAAHSGSSSYWTEAQFRVRAYSAWNDLISDKRAFADPFELRFNHAQVFLANNVAVIRNDANLGNTNLVAWNNLNSQRKFIHNLWIYLVNLSSGLIDSQEDGFEVPVARRTQMLGYKQAIKNIAVTWQAARVELSATRGTGDPGPGFDWAAGGVAVTGQANERLNFEASVAALSASNVVVRTMAELSQDRSAAMYLAANTRHAELGVWKVGDAHRGHMANAPGAPNFNLVSRQAFNADYNVWVP